MAAKKKTKEIIAVTNEESDITVQSEDLLSNSPQVKFLRAQQSFATSSRRNRSSTTNRSNRFSNIENELVPFVGGYDGGYENSSGISVREAIELCQKAHYGFPIFRNAIELMVEFSSSKITLKGGNKRSRLFFKSWLDSIDEWKIQDKFFREYYRSGNVFLHKQSVKIKNTDLIQLSRNFPSAKGLNSLEIPCSYVILNPASVEARQMTNFAQPVFYQVLSAYEIERLVNPQTDKDRQVYESLPEEVKVALKSTNKNNRSDVKMPLDPNQVIAVFYKKQDYEPMSIPMGYSVLEDLNWKQELKQMDMAIARTMQQVVLLITTGAEPDKGGINNKNIAAIQEIFKNESVGRVLVSDYTTKAEFIIPQIADILDPKKYEIVERDIREGLNYILVGQEKFANVNIKITVFMERLKYAREAFVTEFLNKEIENIARDMGFKSWPKAQFEDIDLKDHLQYIKVYQRMAEIGLLTPEELFEAMETNQLPTKEDSVESQRRFKSYRDEGLYLNTVNQKLGESGRPEGSGTPQSVKNVSPIGEGPQSKANISLSKVCDTMKEAQSSFSSFCGVFKSEKDIKRISAKQKEFAESLFSIFVSNEPSVNWHDQDKMKAVISSPVDYNKDRVKELNQVCAEHNVDPYVGVILLESKSE